MAVKLLKPELSLDPEFRTRFRQEAQSAARMSPPTVVRVFDAGEEPAVGVRGSEEPPEQRLGGIATLIYGIVNAIRLLVESRTASSSESAASAQVATTVRGASSRTPSRNSRR